MCVAPCLLQAWRAAAGDSRAREAAGERRLGMRGWTKKRLRVAFLGRPDWDLGLGLCRGSSYEALGKESLYRVPG